MTCVKPILCALTLILITSFALTPASASSTAKTQLELIIEWLTSGNAFMERRAVILIMGNIKTRILKRLPEFKESVIPILNATAPILGYEGVKEVVGVMMPLLMHYGRPQLLKLLNNELFHNATFELIDEFKAAIGNKSGIDNHHPGESLRLIFSRVDWKNIVEHFKPVLHSLNSSGLLHNELLLEILDDFVPRPVLRAMIAMLEKLLSIVRNSDRSSMMGEIIGLVKQDLLRGNYTGLSDSLLDNMKLILKQINWKPIMRIVTRRLESKMNNFTGLGQNETSQCHSDLMYTLEETLAMQKWALAMMDAHGKLGAGLMMGHFHAVGSYKQCHDVRANQIVKNSTDITNRFSGHYCRVVWRVEPPIVSKVSKRKNSIFLSIAWGVCLPDSCGSEDVKALMPADMMSRIGLPLHSVYCGEKPNIKKDGAAIIALLIIAATVVFMSVGTIFHIFRENSESTVTAERKRNIYSPGIDHEMKKLNSEETVTVPLPRSTTEVHDIHAILQADKVTNDRRRRRNVCLLLLESASIITNMKRLISRRTSPGTIHCLHGIRVISLSWIIRFNSEYFAIVSETGIPLTDNSLDARKAIHTFIAHILISAPLAIDTFFIISSTLASYWMLRRLDLDGTVRVSRVIQYVTHRLIRILPTYMIVMAVFLGLYQYSGSGPLWFKEFPAAENCRQNWWTNVLFINNLVHTENMCMQWSWYLANDMQYYIVGLGFILLIYKYAKIGILTTLGLGLVGIISTAVIENKDGGGLITPPTNPDIDFLRDIWMAPWCRVTPYALGLILGYVLHKTKTNHRGPPQKFYYIGWIVTFIAGFAMVFLPYTDMGKGMVKWTQPERTAFESTKHTVWALCMSFVIYACHMGHGGNVDRFLSCYVWVPLSRVTLAAYLVHPIVIIFYVYSREQLIHLVKFAGLYIYIGHWVVTYCTAFLLTAYIEIPFRQIEIIIMRSKSPRCGRRKNIN